MEKSNPLHPRQLYHAQLIVHLRDLRSIAHKFDTNQYLGYRAGENCLTITDDGLYLRDLAAIASPSGTVTVEDGYHEITGKQIYRPDEAIE